MANIGHKRDRQSFWGRIRFKYKLSFFNENTLEEVWSFRLSQLSAFAVLVVFAFILVAVTSFIIVKTPIRNYLPGYLDVEVRKEIMDNALRADSLEKVIYLQAKYLDNITSILMGTMPVDSITGMDSITIIGADFDIPRSENEERFVKEFEEAEKYNLTALARNTAQTDVVFLYKPVSGTISAHYDAGVNHYGIDIVATPRESVLATSDGTVVYTGYDPKYGNVMAIQHHNGFLSVYKHNEALLKRDGDHVVAGEAIALVGNTGKLSTGPHLHFELWYKTNPVNPEEYISF